MCVISALGNSIVCRCIKPDNTLYSIPIVECANNGYNAFSTDDSVKLFGHMFRLKEELDQCREEQ